MSVEQEAIWVAPETNAEELGTFDQPVSDVGRAASMARPGQHIVLKAGVYRGDVTVQQSGLRDLPIHIHPEMPGAAVIAGACWYFYDTSDLIVHGLRFRDSPAGALSVVGACCRNAFTGLAFDGCSRVRRPSCTMFFGGSGARDILVEDCVFRLSEPDDAKAVADGRGTVALMIAQGDSEGGRANMSFAIRANTFVNYGFGVLVGSRDESPGLYGHTVERNVFQGCGGDGVVVKCGDTTVRANLFTSVRRCAVTVAAGRGSLIQTNRMADCGSGCLIAGAGHTVSGNCIIRSRAAALRVQPSGGEPDRRAAPLLAERNCFIDCGAESSYAVESEPGSSCVLDHNLFSGAATPYRAELVTGDTPVLFAADNASDGSATDLPGCARRDFVFARRAEDDYTNDSGYGASGWPLTPDAPRLEASEYVAPGDIGSDHLAAAPEVEKLVHEVDRGRLLTQGLFFEEE